MDCDSNIECFGEATTNGDTILLVEGTRNDRAGIFWIASELSKTHPFHLVALGEIRQGERQIGDGISLAFLRPDATPGVGDPRGGLAIADNGSLMGAAGFVRTYVQHQSGATQQQGMLELRATSLPIDADTVPGWYGMNDLERVFDDSEPLPFELHVVNDPGTDRQAVFRLRYRKPDGNWVDRDQSTSLPIPDLSAYLGFGAAHGNGGGSEVVIKRVTLTCSADP